MTFPDVSKYCFKILNGWYSQFDIVNYIIEDPN